MDRRLAFDTETHLIADGMLFPKLVCVSTFDGTDNRIYLAKEGVEIVLNALKDPNTIVIGHNVAYDLGVICAEAITQGHDAHEILTTIFSAYSFDRVVDTMIRCMLIDIAQGTFQEIEGQRRGRQFGLDNLASRWVNECMDKGEDTWRLHYAALTDVPLDQWPIDAKSYALKDARVTYLVDAAMTAWAIQEGQRSGKIPDEHRQVRAAWVLHLMAGWGVRVDASLIASVRTNLEAQRDLAYVEMDKFALFKKDKKGAYLFTEKGQRSIDQKHLKKLIAEGFAQQGLRPPMTDGRVNKKTGERVPEVAFGADAAEASLSPGPMAYAAVANAVKLLSTYLPALERAAAGIPLTSSPNVLVASGRTSWSRPNLQNPPQVGNIRECIVPRKGNVLVGADLDTIELRALAQSCLELFGHSQMAACLIKGEDLHTGLGADLLGLTYADMKRRLAAGDPQAELNRKVAKAINFGLPGGMGLERFASTAASQGIPLDPDHDEAIRKSSLYKEAWFRRFPEMREFLNHASTITRDDGGPKIIEQPWSARIRGGLTYCSAANTIFQGRVADGTKLALWRLAEACYVDRQSILYGCRLVLFLHDEVILEAPEEIAHDAASELVRILCGALQEVIPDIPITSTAVITRRWLKGAKPVIVNGRLVPSRPIKDEITKKTTWAHDA